MTVHYVDVHDLVQLSRDPGATAPWSGLAPRAIALVDLDEADAVDGAVTPPDFRCDVPVVVVGVTRAEAGPSQAGPSQAALELCDVVDRVGGRIVEQVAETVSRNPVAALALATLLRRSPGMDVSQGLLLESAVFGTLQQGEEFRSWRASVPVRPTGDSRPPVLAVRRDDELHVVLNRPERRNAFDTAMRDALAEQLQLAYLDTTIRLVRLSGAGPGFCSGGDLDEFATAPDPATAHLVRLERSVGALIDRIRDRVTVHLHGSCVGSGIELAAFAGHVEADHTVAISLPEVSMGLIPGAGGTVSLTRRIGRHRTCELALSGRSIDARTALEWGLVDALVAPAIPAN